MWKIPIRPSSKKKEDKPSNEKLFSALYSTKEEAEDARQALIEIVSNKLNYAPSCKEYTGRSEVLFVCPNWYIGDVVEA